MNVCTSALPEKEASPIGLIGLPTVTETTQKSHRHGVSPVPRHRLKYARERPVDGSEADMSHGYRGADVRALAVGSSHFAWSDVPMTVFDRYYNRRSQRCDLGLTRSLPPF